MMKILVVLALIMIASVQTMIFWDMKKQVQLRLDERMITLEEDEEI